MTEINEFEVETIEEEEEIKTLFEEESEKPEKAKVYKFKQLTLRGVAGTYTDFWCNPEETEKFAVGWNPTGKIKSKDGNITLLDLSQMKAREYIASQLEELATELRKTEESKTKEIEF